jgi:hypothetical protein
MKISSLAPTAILLLVSAALPSAATIGVQHHNWWELGMADEVLDEVALYYLGQTWHQSADVAEVLDAMYRTNSSDPSSWTTEFRKLAERMIAKMPVCTVSITEIMIALLVC